MNYFSKPPQPNYIHGDIPKFMIGYYGQNIPDITDSYISLFVNWAKTEYQDTLAYYSMSGDTRTLSLVKKLNHAHVIAMSKEFQLIAKNIDERTWKSLSLENKRILSEAKVIYDKAVNTRKSN